MAFTPRQRKKGFRRESPDQQQQDKEQVQPIDEAEQQQIVDELRQSALKQMEMIQTIFSTACKGAMLLSLLLGITTGDVKGWIHVLLSIFLHWLAIQTAASAKLDVNNTGNGANTCINSNNNNSSTLSLFTTCMPILILLVVVFTSVFKNFSSTNHKNYSHNDYIHHLGLALSNVVTMLGAVYIKHDSKSTKIALEQLDQSQYRYKSL